MSEIYSDEFEEEMKAIPDPKKEPLECLDQFLAILDEFGAWGADRAALNLIMQIEKLKIKTPYERHYLLLCLVSTTLIQVRAHCDDVFGMLPTEKERIVTYSCQKVLRLLDVLRQFKPLQSPSIVGDSDKAQSVFVERHETALNALNFGKMATTIETTLKNVKNVRPEFGHVTEALTKIVTAATPNALSNGIRSLPPHRTRNAKCKRTPFQRTPRQHHNNHHQNDPDALCGVIFCNSKFIAKILYNLCYEASKCDAGLNFLMVQYTVDRAADPVTESKQAENEHRRQEEVLKRFRMHACNLLIGTSVLEEGIELPKCNLVIRWDPPNTYRSYVQCKGRARSHNAQHIIMVAPANTYVSVPLTDSVPNQRFLCGEIECSHDDEEDDAMTLTSTTTIDGDVELMEAETETIVKRLAQYMYIEQILIGKCNNREPVSNELCEADRFTACIQPYQPRKSERENGPSVNLATAILLINKYCAKLPSDTFTKLTPLWRCAKSNRNGQEYFQYTVRLPINSPVKQDILVRCENQLAKTSFLNSIEISRSCT